MCFLLRFCMSQLETLTSLKYEFSSRCLPFLDYCRSKLVGGQGYDSGIGVVWVILGRPSTCVPLPCQHTALSALWKTWRKMSVGTYQHKSYFFFRGICWSSGNLEQKDPTAKTNVGGVQKKSCPIILLLRPCAMPHPIRCPHPSLWGLPHMLHHASCHMAHMNHHDPLESVLVSTHPTLGWPGGISTTSPSVI